MDILLAAAVLPAAGLLWYVYKLDPIEKEPGKLLRSLLILGAVSCIPAIVLESLGTEVLLAGGNAVTVPDLLLENFIIVALSEELCKMFFLRLKTWRHPAFNYVFDGIVYAVFVSLGFAILENIGYVLEFGMATALVRAVTAIPGHAIFGVFMGCFYGLEKRASVQRQRWLQLVFAICSLVIPVLCHGFYDFCASIDGELFLGIFFLFLFLLVFVAARLAKWMSAQAHPIQATSDAVQVSYGHYNPYVDNSLDAQAGYSQPTYQGQPAYPGQPTYQGQPTYPQTGYPAGSVQGQQPPANQGPFGN